MPPGYHPLDVEKEWGKLHVAILEREKQLRSEFERWVAAGRGWGLVVAGKPPEGESLLPREEIPPQAGKPTPGPGQATVGCRLASRPEAGGGPCASAGSLAGSPLTAGPVGVGPQVGVSSAHREQTADGGRPVRRAAEPGRRPAAVGEGEGPGRDRAEAAGRRGGAGRIPEAASPGRRVAAPPSWCAASPDCWLRAEQSRLVGTRQDTREACPRARCLDGVGRMRPRDLGGGQGLAPRPQGAMAGILCILKTCGAGWGEEGKGRGRGLSRSPPCRISGCWQRARQHSGRVMWSGTWTRRTA